MSGLSSGARLIQYACGVDMGEPEDQSSHRRRERPRKAPSPGEAANRMIAAMLPRVERLDPHRHVSQALALREAVAALSDDTLGFLLTSGRHVVCEHPAIFLDQRDQIHREHLAAEYRSQRYEPDERQPFRRAPFVLRRTDGRVYGTAVPTDDAVTSIAIHVLDPGSPLSEIDAYQALRSVCGAAGSQRGADSTAGILVVVPPPTSSEEGLNPIADLLMALAADVPDKPVTMGGSAQIAVHIEGLARQFNVGRATAHLRPISHLDVLSEIGQTPCLRQPRTPDVVRLLERHGLSHPSSAALHRAGRRSPAPGMN